EALRIVDEASAYGIDTQEAEEMLQACITASDMEEYEQCRFIVSELRKWLEQERRYAAIKTADVVKRTRKMLEKGSAPEDYQAVKRSLMNAAKYYEKMGDFASMGEVYELMGKLDALAGDPSASRSSYQRAVNVYFRTGDLEKVARLIMEIMKEIELKEEAIYEVQDAFLIYRDGRLLAHSTKRLRPEADSQILGGMLIAIQNFMEDSLADPSLKSLSELRYGDTRIVIQQGEYLTLAMVISGDVPDALWDRMKKMVEDIESRYERVLSRWDGDLDKLWGVRKAFNEFMQQI
ncbi:MAG: hypothetical protein DRJ35_08080, partial [Thermoprotei archaeon]